MVKVAVTGSDGYIGKQFVNYLEKRKCQVDCFDRVQGRRISDLLRTNINVYDRIYHLAALSRVEACERCKKDAFFQNVYLTAKLAIWAGRKLVFFDTYLDNKTVYGLTKQMARKAVQHFGGQSIRICNIYGYDGPGVVDHFMREKQLIIHG